MVAYRKLQSALEVGLTGVDASPQQKTPLSQSGNLLRLKTACDGAQDGTISSQDYLALVQPVLDFAASALESMEQVSQSSSSFAAHQEILDWTYEVMSEFHQALELMKGYAFSQNLDEASGGYALALAAMVEMDEIQESCQQGITSQDWQTVAHLDLQSQARPALLDVCL